MSCGVCGGPPWASSGTSRTRKVRLSSLSSRNGSGGAQPGVWGVNTVNSVLGSQDAPRERGTRPPVPAWCGSRLRPLVRKQEGRK